MLDVVDWGVVEVAYPSRLLIAKIHRDLCLGRSTQMFKCVQHQTRARRDVRMILIWLRPYSHTLVSSYRTIASSDPSKHGGESCERIQFPANLMSSPRPAERLLELE